MKGDNVMSSLNLNELSMLSFSKEEIIDAWRENIIDEERQIEQTLVKSVYREIAAYSYHTDVAHRNSYSERNTYTQSPARDSYNNQNRYTQASHRDTYSRTAHSNTAGRDTYSRANYSEGYTRYSQTHARSAHRNTYRRYYINKTSGMTRSDIVMDRHSNIPSESSYNTRVNYTKSYSQRNTHTNTPHRNTAARDYYTQSPARNVYSQADRYSQASHRDTYSQRNRYSRSGHTNAATEVPAYSQGFDHENYIPSAPALYEVEGALIEGTLGVYLASYDKNADGFGSQDEASKKIYYDIHIRQIQDLEGNTVSDPWKLIKGGTTTEDFDLDLSDYPDGIYEIKTKAYNAPRVENGVTKTYESPDKIYTFTLVNNSSVADLTIMNAREFQDYAYGLESYCTREGEIKKYIDSILYANAGSAQQKGLFLEIDLKDEDLDTYHKVSAAIRKGGTLITSEYPVVFIKDPDGTPKAGDKTGVVFIPLSDMLDNGCFNDAQIVLYVQEFEDEAMTDRIGGKQSVIGINQANEIIFIDLDNTKPVITVTNPASGVTYSQAINIAVTDTGLGLKESYYQIVPAGQQPNEDDWIEMPSHSKTLIINEPGEYDIYVKATDKSGNTTEVSKKGYKISFLDVDVNVQEIIKIGEDLPVEVEIETNEEIAKVEIWIQDETGKKEIPKTDEDELPHGTTESTYEGTITGTGGIPEGTHIIVVEITFEDGSTGIYTEQIQFVTEYTYEVLNWGVFHTEQWKKNLDHFNSIVSRPNQRTDSTFWAGEKLMVGIDLKFFDESQVNPDDLVKSARITRCIINGAVTPIKQNGIEIEYKVDFTDYLANEEWRNDLVLQPDGSYILSQRAAIWDEFMKERWGDGTPVVLEFELVFVNGDVKSTIIIIEDNIDYYQFHGNKDFVDY